MKKLPKEMLAFKGKTNELQEGDIMKTYIFVYEIREGFYNGGSRIIEQKETFNFVVEAESKKEAYSKYKEFVEDNKETKIFEEEHRYSSPFENYTLLNLIEL